MAVVLLASTEATVVAVEAIVEAIPVVMGVIVTAELILGDCSEALGIRFCGGSGISPLKLARISATLRRSVWLLELGLEAGVLSIGVTTGVGLCIDEGLSVVVLPALAAGLLPVALPVCCSGLDEAVFIMVAATIFWPCLS